MKKQCIKVITMFVLAAHQFVGTGATQSDVPRKGSNMNLAFVLLSKTVLPKGEDIVRAFSLFAPREQSLRLESTKQAKPSEKEFLSFEISTGGTVCIAMMPVPVPNDEADYAVRCSLSAMVTGWKLPAHKAHLIVTSQMQDSSSLIANLSCFTSILAAVTKAANGVGVYWGEAGAT